MRRPGLRPLLGLLVVIVLASVAGFPRLEEFAGEQLATRVEERLSEALGGRCQVRQARLLSTRQVAIDDLACVLDKGPLLGFANSHLTAEFAESLVARSLPQLQHVATDGMQLRLRDLPTLPDTTGSPAEEFDSEAEDETVEPTPLGIRIERAALRFQRFSTALSSGIGGAQVPEIISRLADSGSVRIDRASIHGPDGVVVAAEVHAQVNRRQDSLRLALAVSVGSEGVATLDGTLRATGLADATIRLQDVPISEPLTQLLGGRLRLVAGTLSGMLRHAGWESTGSWEFEAALEQLQGGGTFLGSENTDLPRMRLEGALSLDGEDATVRVDRGVWSLANVGGTFDGALGPVGIEGDEAQVGVQVHADHLPLGKLLQSFPEDLVPRSWSEEIQGTTDLALIFGGPLHQRRKWRIDWEGDFSRMVLASGELASQVDRLRGPFEHSFPKRAADQEATVRVIGPGNRHYVPLNRISRHLVNAVVSTEDAGFFGHSGFSVKELKEALLENLREGSGRGGSTITQQLAKNLFLSGERTLARKLKEALIAWRLESDLPKNRILEIYLNIAEWGPGIYGIHDASDHYFGRSPRVLRPEEAAFLASLLPAPRRYHDYYHSRGVTAGRHALVQDILATMRRMGRLSESAHLLAQDEPVEMVGCRY